MNLTGSSATYSKIYLSRYPSQRPEARSDASRCTVSWIVNSNKDPEVDLEVIVITVLEV